MSFTLLLAILTFLSEALNNERIEEEKHIRGRILRFAQNDRGNVEGGGVRKLF